MKKTKRFIGLGVAGILLLTILTSTALAATKNTQEKNNEKVTNWKMDKQDIHKGKNIKFPEKGIKIQPKSKANLPFEKNSNANEVKKARPEKSDAIK